MTQKTRRLDTVSSKKILDKKNKNKIKMIHLLLLLSTHHSGRWIVLQNGAINSSILKKLFYLSENVYHATGKKRWS